MTGAARVILDRSGALRISVWRPYSQEVQIRLPDLPALIGEIVKVVPRDEHGVALIDQIIAAARAHRRHDRTNAERQRRFRQRRRAQHLRADRTRSVLLSMRQGPVLVSKLTNVSVKTFASFVRANSSFGLAASTVACVRGARAPF